MSKIFIKVLSEDALIHLKKNVESVAEKIVINNDNDWIFNEFPQPMFLEKKFEINDFDLIENLETRDKKIDTINSINIYENLKFLPRYILSDERFWLWLHLDKFYSVVRGMMKINSSTTINNMWMHSQGRRRGLMFGVLSRCYFRVSLSVQVNNSDPYSLTRWIIDNPERFRNLTWSSFSSEEHLVRGILTGERRAIQEFPEDEHKDLYTEISKYISEVGSVRLLDSISEKDIEDMVYKKMLDLMGKGVIL